MHINNMKRYFTLLFISFFTLTGLIANAQVKSYIGLDAGLSTPTGDFGQSAYSNNKAGFAKKGVTFGFDAAVYIHKNFAIALKVSFQDQPALNTNDALKLATGYTSTFTADEVNVSSVNRYNSLNFLLGPQYSIEYHKFILDLRASAGLVQSFTTPNITAIIAGGTSTAGILTQNSSSNAAFGYSGTVGLRYKLGDSWCVVLRSGYIASPGIKISNSVDNTTGRLVTKQPISEMQTTLGLTLSL